MMQLGLECQCCFSQAIAYIFSGCTPPRCSHCSHGNSRLCRTKGNLFSLFSDLICNCSIHYDTKDLFRVHASTCFLQSTSLITSGKMNFEEHCCSCCYYCYCLIYLLAKKIIIWKRECG